MSPKYTIIFIFVVAIISNISCNNSFNKRDEVKHGISNTNSNYLNNPILQFKPLLASRFNSLGDLKKVVNIKYFKGNEGKYNNPSVKLVYKQGNNSLVSILETGITQSDIIEARDGGFFGKVALIFRSPYSIAQRGDMNKVYKLSRRIPWLFKEGDVAFYDISKKMVKNIYNIQAYTCKKDSTDKGYINTFNHITAQAIVTSFFSKKLANHMAKMHELKNMSELVTGKFTKEQLISSENNPVDNYVDLVNNEIGQKLGIYISRKMNLSVNNIWTPNFLAAFLNEIQQYYSWSLHISFRPFTTNDILVQRFCKKINMINSKRLPYHN